MVSAEFSDTTTLRELLFSTGLPNTVSGADTSTASHHPPLVVPFPDRRSPRLVVLQDDLLTIFESLARETVDYLSREKGDVADRPAREPVLRAYRSAIRYHERFYRRSVAAQFTDAIKLILQAMSTGAAELDPAYKPFDYPFGSADPAPYPSAPVVSSSNPGLATVDVVATKLGRPGFTVLKRLIAINVENESPGRQIFEALESRLKERGGVLDYRQDVWDSDELGRPALDQTLVAKMVAYQTSDGPNVPLGLWYWGSGFVVTVLGYLDEGSPTERQQPIVMLSPVTSINSASPTFLSFLTYAFLSLNSFEIPESLRPSLRQRVIEFTKAREEQQVPGLQDSGRLVALSSSGGEKRVEEEPGVGACSKGWSQSEETIHLTAISVCVEFALPDTTPSVHHHLTPLDVDAELVTSLFVSESPSRRSVNLSAFLAEPARLPLPPLPPLHRIVLDRGPFEGPTAMVFLGSSNLGPVAVEYGAEECEDDLTFEAAIYARLTAEPALKIPRFYGLFRSSLTNPPCHTIVIEDVGDSLANWADLSKDESANLLRELKALHRLEVGHGDLAPRNVCRRSDGALFFIDFANGYTHDCDGNECRELDQIRRELNRELIYNVLAEPHPSR